MKFEMHFSCPTVATYHQIWKYLIIGINKENYNEVE